MKELACFVEGESDSEFLRGLLAKVLPADVVFYTIVFGGKRGLAKKLPARLRAWRKPDCVFLVLRDQDDGDCREIKEQLKKICAAARKPAALVRIACRELENWYLGDLAAVETVYPQSKAARKINQRKFQSDNVDRLNGKDEMEKLCGGEFGEIDCARRMGQSMDISVNQSVSFRHLISGVKKLCQ